MTRNIRTPVPSRFSSKLREGPMNFRTLAAPILGSLVTVLALSARRDRKLECPSQP